MDWQPQQVHALDEFAKWRKDPHGKQVFHLFGYAGTGKTTLAKHLAESERSPIFAAYTGKAALVLRKKGCTDAQTLHSLIYRPAKPKKEDEDPAKAGKPEKEEKLRFVLKDDSDLYNASLLLIDEVSMVDSEMGGDLLSFGRKILVMGDPGQLPPVNGTGFFNPSRPEIMLTDIRRQALDNPLIKMSLDIRTGRGVPKGRYGDSNVIAKPALTPNDAKCADQIICGLNETREKFNGRMRLQLGFSGPIPQIGERLICLKNDRNLGIFNGGMWTVLESEPEGEIVKLKLRSLDIDTLKTEVKVPQEYFKSMDEVKKLPKAFINKHQQFTYGYAITCHKSQGSQWDNVLIWNENYMFRENGRQWLYTAVTRAAERITLCL